MRQAIEIKIITSDEQFLELLGLPKAIIYFLVDWSGQERVSRTVFLKTLSEIKFTDVPIFKIDCADQKQKYVENWLINQTENIKLFYYGGYGETLLIKKGSVIDFISDPGKVGVEKVKEKIESWLAQE